MIWQRGSGILGKPTYYLWRDMYSSREEYENTKDKYTRMGFRVVTFQEGQSSHDLPEGIRAVIKNHMETAMS